MRVSQFFISTLKEAPSEAELVSHRLMVRAGYIRKLASGLYTWMPLGLRVLRKVENIVREEMDRSGGIELLMPAIQPAELWQETGRWEVFGPQMLKIKDRHDNQFCFGPTHEEVITDIARREIRSYRQLPINFYQIQTKFRDEVRPRFGVMRAREFLMKDAYSFHADYASLEQTYRVMYDTYSRIFTRLGLKFRAVAADTGAIGGSGSHEFHVLADAGEDALAYCPTSDYAANVELAEAVAPSAPRAAATQPMEKVATPGQKSIAEVAEFLNVPAQKILKTLLIKLTLSPSKPNVALDGPYGVMPQLYLVLIRGDHQINETKLTNKLKTFRTDVQNFEWATEEEIKTQLKCRPGYIGPHDHNLGIIADKSVEAMSDFVCGANEDGYHLTGFNWGRDWKDSDIKYADIRNVEAGDPSPDGKGTLEICRGIEVGHIFQLRTKYAEAMKATFLDESGKSRAFEMGCYGIGVTRIVGAAIEQNHDARGIIFPQPIAPFQLALVPISYRKSAQVRETCDRLYRELAAAGIEVLLDDRDERPGVMFADMELIGIPHRVVVGERGLKQGKLEYQGRCDQASTPVAMDELIDFVKARLCAR